MIKSVEKAVEEVVKGKTQNIELYRYEWSDEQEKQVLTPLAIYEDIAGYQASSEWVAVTLRDGTTHVHTRENIDYIKHYSVEAI
jgi:hypothetical protein